MFTLSILRKSQKKACLFRNSDFYYASQPYPRLRNIKDPSFFFLFFFLERVKEIPLKSRKSNFLAQEQKMDNMGTKEASQTTRLSRKWEKKTKKS